MFDLVFVVFDIVVILVILIYCTFAFGHYSIIYVSFSYERGSLLKSQWICFRFMLYFFSVRITEMLHAILLLFCYFQSHYVWFSYYNILFCSICIFALGHYSIMHVLFIYERGSSRLLKCQWNCFRFILYFFSVRITELLHSILVLFCYFQSHYMRFGYYSILFFFNLGCWVVNEYCF